MTLDSPRLERTEDRYLMVFEEVYATDIDDLWRAVTTRERLARWMADYTGDLREGGSWVVASEDGGSWGKGRVLSCNPPRAFETEWHAIDEEPTRLRVRLEEVDGGTLLVLEHTGIQSIYYGAGWQTYLEQLVSHLAEPEGFTPDEETWNTRYLQLKPEYDARFAAL